MCKSILRVISLVFIYIYININVTKKKKEETTGQQFAFVLQEQHRVVLGALLVGTWVLVGTRRTQGWDVLVLTHFLPKLLAGASAKWGWAH